MTASFELTLAWSGKVDRNSKLIIAEDNRGRCTAVCSTGNSASSSQRATHTDIIKPCSSFKPRLGQRGGSRRTADPLPEVFRRSQSERDCACVITNLLPVLLLLIAQTPPRIPSLVLREEPNEVEVRARLLRGPHRPRDGSCHSTPAIHLNTSERREGGRGVRGMMLGAEGQQKRFCS